jgi:hypothetical protein
MGISESESESKLNREPVRRVPRNSQGQARGRVVSHLNLAERLKPGRGELAVPICLVLSMLRPDPSRGALRAGGVLPCLAGPRIAWGDDADRT